LLDLENLVCRSEPETYGPKPACRNNHTTAVQGEKIYFHGGHDGNQWLDDLHVLNTMSLVWSKPKVSGQKPSARACHTMSRVGRKLYMFGGYDGDKCFNDIDILDMDTMTWI
jgi:N-acetylneuraminic acid mutarotase